MFNILHRKLLAGTPLFGHDVHSWFWNSSSSPATSKTADSAREAKQAVCGKRHRGNEFCHRLAVWIAPPLDQGGQLREQLRLWGLQQWWLAGYSRQHATASIFQGNRCYLHAWTGNMYTWKQKVARNLGSLVAFPREWQRETWGNNLSWKEKDTNDLRTRISLFVCLT